MDGLRDGRFSLRHATTIVDHASSLKDELHAEFERIVVPFAASLTASKLSRKAHEIRERLDAESIEKRHEKAFADREVFFEPARDGMAWLHLYTTAPIALAAFNRVHEMSIELQGVLSGSGDARTITQLRADLTADLLLDGAVGERPEFRIRPSVAITVPVLTMLDHRSVTGELELPVLEGYGPIDVDTARQLAGAAKSWLRVLTHPETGATLSVGRDRYRVPAGLRAWLQRRDGTCRKPGCGRPAHHCDLDHTEEWQHGGQTAHDNLAHLCESHHTEKHHTDIAVRHLPGGDLEWTLASGHTYVTHPEHRCVDPSDLDPGLDKLDPRGGLDPSHSA
jgi:hypothetical protein